MKDRSVQKADDPIVRIAHLRKSYGEFAAIKNINLTFREGEFVVLLGPSGVGKSTLLRCLNLLVRPSEGQLWINGSDLANLSRSQLLKARRKIGMIFQEFHLVDRLSVLTNVMCGRLSDLPLWRALVYKFPEEDQIAAARALCRVGLESEELWHRRADQLSGGQKQRVAIARALMQSPSVLLADEPIASLDVIMRAQIMELISDIARKDKITVIMSLHQIDVARRYADRVIALNQGEVCFDGPPAQLDEEAVARIFQKAPHVVH
ncbi:phosphonate ABC transporter ATP-binding protein [Bradyrhizobium sp. AUGA SZCCT0431]|uniref:phosphonate ABC transporter ATP-binding protein n=1 Tax=Bradyrhizobium sp. AUGA SZCCT0431 TaxID=2807674 RepID=UPI001BA65B9F|nr:phosphonate ABC transporter ATP-binding protein [Bradyrhizobium sp. AUGA SZCCT0431]MBR1146158.1 phosphonate ABC transporter ATP-binding protein [Bradyrhizobium sp. AUGA SZCCT0431]